MNNMDWLDSLTPQQMHLADMIVHKAQKEGVDPKLALALAFRESSLKHGSFEKDKDDKLVFKPSTGKAGEVGVMQVMPNTAKLFGYKPEDLNNLEKNMEIGLKVLKSHLGQFNDPLLAAAAYNAGPNHPYFQDPDNSPLPDTTQQYLKDINQLGGFQAAPPAEAQEEVEAEEPPAGPPVDFRQQLNEYGPGAAGAAVGAAVGSKLASSKATQQGAQFFAELMRQQGLAPGAAPGSAPGAATGTSGTKWMKNWAGIDREIAGGVPEASAAYQRGKGRGKVTGRLSKMYGPGALQPGGLSVQGASAFPAIAAPPAPPAASLLDDAVAKLGQIAKGGLAVASSAPVAGALGGYSAATSGVEAFERGQKGDVAGAKMAGLGTLGALAAIPHPVTRAIGFGASVMSPLGLAVMDRMRDIQKQPPPAPATAAEMQQAQQPAFMTARP